MAKFELKINDREYVETVYMNKEFSYDLFKNDEKTFEIEVKKNNISFKDEKGEVMSGGVIYQSYDEWMNDTDNLITLHDLDKETLSENEKEFIYFIEASIQLFYNIGADATWPNKWWLDLDLNKFINYEEPKEELSNTEPSNSIDKLKKLFHLN